MMQKLGNDKHGSDVPCTKPIKNFKNPHLLATKAPWWLSTWIPGCFFQPNALTYVHSMDLDYKSGLMHRTTNDVKDTEPTTFVSANRGVQIKVPWKMNRFAATCLQETRGRVGTDLVIMLLMTRRAAGGEEISPAI